MSMELPAGAFVNTVNAMVVDMAAQRDIIDGIKVFNELEETIKIGPFDRDVRDAFNYTGNVDPENAKLWVPGSKVMQVEALTRASGRAFNTIYFADKEAGTRLFLPNGCVAAASANLGIIGVHAIADTSLTQGPDPVAKLYSNPETGYDYRSMAIRKAALELLCKQFAKHLSVGEMSELFMGGRRSLGSYGGMRNEDDPCIGVSGGLFWHEDYMPEVNIFTQNEVLDILLTDKVLAAEAAKVDEEHQIDRLAGLADHMIALVVHSAWRGGGLSELQLARIVHIGQKFAAQGQDLN